MYFETGDFVNRSNRRSSRAMKRSYRGIHVNQLYNLIHEYKSRNTQKLTSCKEDVSGLVFSGGAVTWIVVHQPLN